MVTNGLHSQSSRLPVRCFASRFLGAALFAVTVKVTVAEEARVFAGR